jgi:hypothetical protein
MPDCNFSRLSSRIEMNFWRKAYAIINYKSMRLMYTYTTASILPQTGIMSSNIFNFQTLQFNFHVLL